MTGDMIMMLNCFSLGISPGSLRSLTSDRGYDYDVKLFDCFSLGISLSPGSFRSLTSDRGYDYDVKLFDCFSLGISLSSGSFRSLTSDRGDMIMMLNCFVVSL